MEGGMQVTSLVLVCMQPSNESGGGRIYIDMQWSSAGTVECATTVGVGRENRPPLHPIPVQLPFQIMGLDIMELPKTTLQGNRYVIMFQDFLAKWPLVFPLQIRKQSGWPD